MNSEIEEYRMRMALIELQKKEDNIEDKLVRMEEKYKNCKEENVFLRKELNEKTGLYDKIAEKYEVLQAENALISHQLH